MHQPDFLTGRGINEATLEVRVQVVGDGVQYYDETLFTREDGDIWLNEAQILVPEGSDTSLDITWLERGVTGLPAALNGVLTLAVYEQAIPTIGQDLRLEIDSEDYIVNSSAADPRPELDLDNDGFGNLEERLAGSNVNLATDTPSDADVLIVYNPNKPIINGQWEPAAWDLGQFNDRQGNDLLINQVLIDNDVIQPGEDRGYSWGGMHDGESLYLIVFAEAAAEEAGGQTPFGDSVLAYNDDSIDIYWDGNNSKGASYDGIDDFHAIIPLLSTLSQDDANRTGIANTRFALGDRSTPISVSAFEFAVCLCDGFRQVYEIKLDLAAAKIPIGSPFGLEIQLNNDVDGNDRDAKWAWHNSTGQDDTWRFPLRMGTAFLEPLPVP